MPEEPRGKLPKRAASSQEIAEVSADIIRALKADKGLTNLELARAIESSEATIRSLEDMKIEKVPLRLMSAIGTMYGVEYVQPFFELFGCRGVPLEIEESFAALPAVTSLAAKLAAALADGRHEPDHQALAAMLPDLRKVDAAVSRLRARASELGLAA